MVPLGLFPWDMHSLIYPSGRISTQACSSLLDKCEHYFFFSFDIRPLVTPTNSYCFTMPDNIYNYARVRMPLQAMISDDSLRSQVQTTGLTKAYYFRIQQ